MTYKICRYIDSKVILTLDVESLQGINLDDAILHRANLMGVNLRNASLRNTDLRNANLRAADLTDADLSGADISNAFLERTILTNTKFISANLCGAILDGATLRGTDLSNADVIAASMQNTQIESSVMLVMEASIISVTTPGARFDENGNLLLSSLEYLYSPSPEILSLTGTKFDADTVWPLNFDPIKHGAIRY